MSETERLDAIIPMIYEAALDRSLWPEVMRRFGDLIGAHCSALIRQSVTTGIGQAVSVGYDPTLMNEYFSYYGSRNILLHRMGRPPPGLVYGDRDVLPKEELRKTEYYNDFLFAKLDINAVLMGSLWVDDTDVVAVNFCRSPRAEEIESEDKRRLDRLVPHLQRAFALSLRLGTLQVETGRSRELLDRAAHGILVLDAAGRVLYANSAAERLLATGDGLFGGSAGLSAITPGHTARLNAAIARAAQGNDGGAVRLERLRCGRPLYALATPLASELPWMQTGGPRVLLLLRDPEPQPVLSEGHLRALFGLTAAEARVALHLYRGENLVALAAALGISRHTARVHVNAVLRKTGAQRQAELIRRLTMLAELADHRVQT